MKAQSLIMFGHLDNGPSWPDLHAYRIQEWSPEYIDTVSVSSNSSRSAPRLHSSRRPNCCCSMLNPKPVVVGIAWVVECVEKRAKVDEERFKIDVEVINVAGGNNKVLPSHLHPICPH